MEQLNEYKSPNGTVRLVNDDVLVRVLPLRDRTESGIIIPETAGERGEAGIMATGVVLAVGFVRQSKPRGEKSRIPGLEKGERVVFIRFLKEQHTNKYVQEHVEPDVIRIKTTDILLVHGPDDKVL